MPDLIEFREVTSNQGEKGYKLFCPDLPACLKCSIWPDRTRGYNRRTVVNGIGKINWHIDLDDAKKAARGWAMRHLKQIASTDDIAAYRARRNQTYP